MKNIAKVIKILEKHFHYQKLTTLNRMRKQKKPDAFKILIACLLSLRVRDETTEKISKELFRVADTPQKIIKMPLARLKKIIFSSGHYKKKARVLKHVSRELLEKFHGEVPNDKAELLAIKGIGQKTANIVLNFAFNQLVIPVDVNVHRISNRLGWVKTKTAEKTEPALENLVPKKYWRELNGLFVLHGKTICVPISPKCSICPVKKYCKRVGVVKSR